MTFAGKAAIAGIGQTEFSKDSHRSELRLACEAAFPPTSGTLDRSVCAAQGVLCHTGVPEV